MNAEWARLWFDVFKFGVGVGLTLLQMWLLLLVARTFWHHFTEGRSGDFPQVRVLMRRLYCRHHHVSRVKTRYGFHKTLCSACGVDVNRGRKAEYRR